MRIHLGIIVSIICGLLIWTLLILAIIDAFT